MISFKIKELEKYTIVFIGLDIITPNELRDIVPPSVDSGKGVILSGRGPIWLYGFLTHCYHPTKFVAIYDPRLKGAAVVESHDLAYKVGDVIEI
ncbi:MAG: CRISPR-associated ring nuclease Crn3/Csx3 [Candidatus Anstonellales archaeon]